MVKREFEIQNETGLHARAAAVFVQVTNRFSSDIFIHKDTSVIDAKSIMGIIAMGVPYKTKITVTCEGMDEVQAMDAIEKLILEDLPKM
ncbi:MAG: HPr family phosphocarrier protein [Firmicutes bacterium]|jgi:phosphocarrier protein|nr:HPr family phosphocarrier protein [Bacillota bacterium]